MINSVIRKKLPKLLELTKNQNRIGFINLTYDIEFEVVKIYSNLSEDWSDIKKVLKDMRYYIHAYTVLEWRIEFMEELYLKLCSALNKRKHDLTLKKLLATLFSEMIQDFEIGINKSDWDALDNLKDLGREINSLDVRIKNERPDLYEKYKIATNKLAAFFPQLVKLQPLEKDGKLFFHRDSIGKVSDSFSEFVSAFNEFLISFETPIVEKKKDEPLNTEDLKDQIIKKI